MPSWMGLICSVLFAQALTEAHVAGFVNCLKEFLGQELTCLLLSVQVQHDFNRNKFFDAQEAKDYGIVDQIIRPPRSQSLGV